MSLRVRFGVAGLAVAGLTWASLTYTVSARSQTPPGGGDVTSALLTEVHALRIAMEQNAAVLPRVQLVLARLNIEEQRVTQLAAQVEQNRYALSAAVLEGQKLADRLPELERGLQTVVDPQARRSYESEQENVKRQIAAQSRLEQLLRARETETLQALNMEQARWSDLNARLDELERLLAPVARQP